MKKRSRIFSLGAAAVLVLLLLFSAEAKAAAVSALKLCGSTLLPSLFPFYAAANLLVYAGLPPVGKPVDALMRRLFGLPGAAAPALLLGLLGGYPVGASVAADLYRQGQLTKEEAVTLSCFANNAGPAFILGAAGLAVFDSASIGFLLYAIHAVSAVLTGLAMRRPFADSSVLPKPSAAEDKPVSEVLPTAILAAVRSMELICAFVVLFSVLLAVLKSLSTVRAVLRAAVRILPTAEALLSGTAELSCGILLLQGTPQAAALITASFLLGWGGLCVFLQSAAVLSAAGLPSRQCLVSKLIQALIAAGLTCLFCAIRRHTMKFLPEFAVFSLILLCILRFRGRKTKNSLL